MVDTSRGKSRQLALNACNACRQRKTKCDEVKPHCGRCSRLELDCTYTETVASRKDLSLSELNGTLQRLEDKLDWLVDSSSQERPQGNSERVTADHIMVDSPASGILLERPGSSLRGETSRVLSTEGHSTAPQHLLSWACSPLQLAQADLRYPVALEITQSKLQVRASGETDSSWLSRLSLSQFRHLAQLYFSHFHASYMILDEAHFYQHSLQRVLQDDFGQGVDACIVLLVLALGSVAAFHAGNEGYSFASDHSSVLDAGLDFFNMAKNLFPQVGGVDWPSVQCLLLKASFYSCKLRVFDSWRATNEACINILILLPLQPSLNAQHCQLYWIAYLQESQILAEFDFPASGLSDCSSDVPLPVVPDPGTGPQYREYQFSLLAVIALRRLLNRIHAYLYGVDSTLGLANDVNRRQNTSFAAQEGDAGSNSMPSPQAERMLAPPQSLISELDRQLEEWRKCLPPSLQFPTFSPSRSARRETRSRSTSERLRENLMARYFAAKSILHRPFLYRLLHSNDTAHLEQQDVAGAQVAIDSAFQSFLHNGVLHEPLFLSVHPINTWRSLFALELQIKFFLAADESLHFILPDGWDMVQEVRQDIAMGARALSPCVARDAEILETL